jgi:excisionase family DNA binding protein
MRSNALTMTVPKAGELLGLGRNGSYEAAHRGEIPTIRFGRLLRVPVAALERMLEAVSSTAAETRKIGPVLALRNDPKNPLRPRTRARSSSSRDPNIRRAAAGAGELEPPSDETSRIRCSEPRASRAAADASTQVTAGRPPRRS